MAQQDTAEVVLTAEEADSEGLGDDHPVITLTKRSKERVLTQEQRHRMVPPSPHARRQQRQQQRTGPSRKGKWRTFDQTNEILAERLTGQIRREQAQ